MKAKKNTRRSATKAKTQDAIALLKEDHKMVLDIFKQYKVLAKKDGNGQKKLHLVDKACDALAIHAQIEEEIFYPAIMNVVEQPLLAEAFVEHDGAKELMEQLQDMDPRDALFDAKFIVLGEQVKHHIEEEETRIFPQLRKADIDLKAIGAHLKEMKKSLERQPHYPERYIPREEMPFYVQH